MRYFKVVFLFVGCLGFSQSISKQVIGPGGQTFENGTYKLSYTTGEVAVGAMTSEDGSIQLGNGYYPSLDLSTLNTESPELQLQVKVFPNPVTENIYITHPTEQHFVVGITDVSGKQILQTTHQKQQPLSVQTLTTGTYFVTVTTKDSKQTNTYKIIKKMKKFYAILCLAIASLTQLQAQAPQGFNYQATVRNSAGDLIVNTNVYFKFNVIQGSQTSLPVFTETHYVPTDDLGQVNLIIGQGTANTGVFSELDWSLGSFYLGIELNTGSGYVAMGTTQLLSVPYALYAENSGNSTPITPNLETVLAENNSAGQQQIKDLLDPTDAQDAVTKNYAETQFYSQSEVDALIANLQSQIDDLDTDNSSGSITDQDGNTYDYLTYGVQVWTVENAEMVTYRDGTPIPQVTDNTEWQNLTTGAWSYYNNDPTKPRLYNWYAVMGIHDTDPNTPNKEFAPEGWHVPTDAEWTTLENYLIANGYNYDGTTTENKIAKAMASTTGWNSSTSTGEVGNDQSLNNSSGFNAFPEGYRNHIGSFYNEGYYAIFWSSTENNSSLAWNRNLDDDLSGLNRGYSNGRYGFSVRFVRD